MSDTTKDAVPVAWFYYEDGEFIRMYDSEDRAEAAREKFGGDVEPVYKHPAQVQAEAEPVAEVIKWRTLTGHTAWDFKVFDKTLEHGAKLYTSPQPSPTAVVLDDERNEREAFEHWMTHDYGYDAIDMQTHQDGVYILSAVHEAWEGWQGARRAALEEGYALGFNASGEGWNGEYPYRDLTKDPKWIKERDENLSAATSITSP